MMRAASQAELEALKASSLCRGFRLIIVSESSSRRRLVIECRSCGGGWRWDDVTKQMNAGTILHLLNHEAGHEAKGTNK